MLSAPIGTVEDAGRNGELMDLKSGENRRLGRTVLAVALHGGGLHQVERTTCKVSRQEALSAVESATTTRNWQLW